jgi:hypothetical protein
LRLSFREFSWEEVDSRQLKVEREEEESPEGSSGCDFGGLGRSGAAPVRDRGDGSVGEWPAAEILRLGGHQGLFGVRRIDRDVERKNRTLEKPQGCGTQMPSR